VLAFLRRYFIAGLLILAPIVVTAYIFWKVFVSFDRFLAPVQDRYPFLDFPGLGFVAAIVLVILTGFLAGNLIGRKVIGLGERLLNHIPLIRGIYSTVKEISEVFLADRRTVFRRVVLIQYPHPGSYALAFVTKEGYEYFNHVTGRELVNVFVPTTPNPTSGFLLMVPKNDVIPVEVSVEEGLKMVISGGAVSAPMLTQAPSSEG